MHVTIHVTSSSKTDVLLICLFLRKIKATVLKEHRQSWCDWSKIIPCLKLHTYNTTQSYTRKRTRKKKKLLKKSPSVGIFFILRPAVRTKFLDSEPIWNKIVFSPQRRSTRPKSESEIKISETETNYLYVSKFSVSDHVQESKFDFIPVSYTHLTLPTTPYV